MSPATASEPVVGSVTLTVRSVSLVRAPLVSAPVTGATSSVTEVMVGAFGAVVSSVTVKLADALLTLPAASVILAVIV